jgi:redox-sensing transcriptional repressor
MFSGSVNKGAILQEKNLSGVHHRTIVCRLSQYRSALRRFELLGFQKIFSPYLAQTIGVSSAVVRKDFSEFGITGNKRGGYAIDALITQIDHILGKNEVLNVALAGVGNLGQALLRYRNFAAEGIHISVAFDLDPSKCRDKENPPILPVKEMEAFISSRGIRIGLIAVPELVAQEVAQTMVRAGITGILNFAPIQLQVPALCTVHNVNLALEISALAYYAMNDRECSIVSGAGQAVAGNTGEKAIESLNQPIST